MRVAKLGAGVGRGVWVAPWLGPNGEMVLCAVKSDRRCIAWRLIPAGANHHDACLELLDLLDTDDPDGRRMLKAI